jgi:L-fuconolactonase
MTALQIIDAHQHFWRLDAPGHVWPDSTLPAIHRDFLPGDLRDAARDVDLVATVLVQSQPTDFDTDWLCTLATHEPSVGAVVGWVDLAAEAAPKRIADLARSPKLRGLRPMLQSIADDEWILQRAVAPAIVAMISHHLTFDALVQPRHLPVLRRFAMRWPELRIVVDHGAKPFIARGELDPWRDDIAALGALGNVYCKLSGLRTEQDPEAPAETLLPYVSHLVQIFGDRLMWGSDWPVLRNSGDGYRTWLETARSLAGLGSDGEDKLFAQCAVGFYRIDHGK